MHGREWITEGAARTGETGILAALWTEMLIGAAYTAVTVNRTRTFKRNPSKIKICCLMYVEKGQIEGETETKFPFYCSYCIHCRPFGTPGQRTTNE